jgi:mono/diheme cytochrome c family protein
MFVALALLAFWGMSYLDSHGGGFEATVYSPYGSLAQLNADQPKSKGGDIFRKGENVYQLYCSVCHQPNGAGNPSTFIPPLAGSDWVQEKSPGRIIRIVSKGLTGPVQVSGQPFNGGLMFAVGDTMQGEEDQKAENIAAVLTYIRGSFGNKASAVTVDEVKAVRAKIADRSQNWTADELLKIAPEE